MSGSQSFSPTILRSAGEAIARDEAGLRRSRNDEGPLLRAGLRSCETAVRSAGYFAAAAARLRAGLAAPRAEVSDFDLWYLSMNFSTLSRAMSSGTWLCGDFMR